MASYHPRKYHPERYFTGNFFSHAVGTFIDLFQKIVLGIRKN